MTKPRTNPQRPVETSSRKKGSIVEEITAWLHDWPEVQVERNVWLPSRGDPNRKREIDVLVTAQITGYLVRVAIECKNESTPIGSGLMDAFAGKLQDVGIPCQQGIYVSASGYTKNAIRRAEDDGIRVLTLRGLSSDGLKSCITTTAHQSVAFILAQVTEVAFETASPEPLPHIPLFLDQTGRLCGTIPHLIADMWRTGSIPPALGEHRITIPIPDGWKPVSAGHYVQFIKREIQAAVHVRGLTFTVEGTAEQYSLVDAATRQSQKVGIKAFFKSAGGRYPLTIIDDENDLKRLTSRPGMSTVVRIKVPRIL